MKIEKEYKVMITQDDYETIINHYKGELDRIVQTNIYYDTIPTSTDKAVRIRKLYDKYLFTLKHFDGVLYEYEFELPNLSVDHPKVKELFEKFEIAAVREIGSMQTTRYLMRDNYGEFCIDCSEYNGIIDYEIEYELFNDQLDLIVHFNEWLEQFNLNYLSNCKSKIHRFKESLIKEELL